MNLTMRVDKLEWSLSDVKTRTETCENDQTTWKSRFHDIALVGVLCLILLLIVSFYFWRHLDTRLDTIDKTLVTNSKDFITKDSYTELKLILERAASRMEYLEKLIEEKHKSPVVPDVKLKK
jgi:hypothetical protein